MADFVKLGGFTGYRNVTPETTDMLNQLKPSIFAAYLKDSISSTVTITMFEPITQKSQVVNGVRYAVKIQITTRGVSGSPSFIHVYFLKKFDNTLILERIETNKTAIDTL